MDQTCRTWLQAQVRRGMQRELFNSVGRGLLVLPVLLVNYAFALVSILYFYYLARVRANALSPEDPVNRGFVWLRSLEFKGFGPDWWALIALGLLCVVYFAFFRQKAPGRLALFTEPDTGRTVVLVPEDAKGHERTTLRRATRGMGGIVFSIVFALPILLEGAWMSLREANRFRSIEVELCARTVAQIEDRNGTIEMAQLEEVLGRDALQRVLPQLWLLEGVTLHGDDPQRVELARLARDELFIFSVA